MMSDAALLVTMLYHALLFHDTDWVLGGDDGCSTILRMSSTQLSLFTATAPLILSGAQHYRSVLVGVAMICRHPLWGMSPLCTRAISYLAQYLAPRHYHTISRNPKFYPFEGCHTEIFMFRHVAPELLPPVASDKCESQQSFGNHDQRQYNAAHGGSGKWETSCCESGESHTSDPLEHASPWMDFCADVGGHLRGSEADEELVSGPQNTDLNDAARQKPMGRQIQPSWDEKNWKGRGRWT